MARRIAVGLSGLGLAILALGVAVLVLTHPWYTQTLSARYSLSTEAGLSSAQAQSIAEDVRAFVVEGRGTLPEAIDGRPAFDASAVSHLTDVRDVFAGARLATWVLLAALLLVGAAAWSSGRRDAVSSALKIGAWSIVASVTLAGLVAVVDFDVFFSAFHSLFFAAGTWTFPYDSLLIQLFPERFWVVSGVSWGALVGAIALGYWLLGDRLARAVRADNA